MAANPSRPTPPVLIARDGALVVLTLNRPDSLNAIDRAIIRWPSGRQQTIERPAVDMLHRIREPHAG